ncbi:MAG TPA: HAD-IIB family hydrolase [Candidatus Saccharimonadales bacterium]|nr:HAD-IIB family hydrolase [Candidatus Saccharimonadales bacterium]
MKLIVADIDQTLIDSPVQKLPSERLVKAIQNVKGAGYLVTCATGRSRSWAKPFLEAAQFTAPCILGGGTHLVDPKNQEIIWDLPLPVDQLENIKNILRPNPDLHVLFNDYSEDDYINGGWQLDKLMLANEVFLMEVVYLQDDLAIKLAAAFTDLPGVTSIKMRSFRPPLVDIHVLNAESTKENAIAKLREKLNVSFEDTIGIGDGHNDIHIFNAVKTKIAVENAIPELKDTANLVIGDVKDDAVAKYLESLIKQIT